jgi:putative transposase
MSQIVPTSQAFAKQAPMLFRAGMLVSYNTKIFRIRNAEPDYMVLQHTLDHSIEMVTAQVWSQAYVNGAVNIEEPEKTVVIHPITDSEKLAQAERILAYVNELEIRKKLGSGRTRLQVIDYIAKKIIDKVPPHEMQLYRWYKKWEKVGKDINAFMNQKQPRTRPVTDAQIDFAMYIIDTFFLIPHGGNRSELFRTYKEQYVKDTHKQHFKLPEKPMSKTALENILDTLDPYEVTATQKGLKTARTMFRNSNEKIVTFFPGERVEIDAVHLNLGIVDDETGEYQGKIILFLAIDVHTRYILGYSIVYGLAPAESAEGAVNLMRHVVSPKLTNGNYQNDWHCIGTPYCFHADNGAAFIAENTLRFCAMLNADLHRSESRKSQRRPFIERFNRTLRDQLMTKIPGYLGKRLDEKDFNKTIEQAAVVTLLDFTRYLEQYIVDIYHQNPHKGLDGLSPSQKLEQCRNDFMPRPVPNLAKLNALVGTVKKRAIQETHGVQIENLCYHSTQLKELRFSLMKNRKTVKKIEVEVIFNCNDISTVTVLLPNALESIIVKVRDKTIEPGTSLVQYKAMKAMEIAGITPKTPKTFLSKHDEHKKLRGKGQSKIKNFDSTAPKSKVVTHESYDTQAAMNEGKSRLAADDSRRTFQSSVQVDMTPAVTKPTTGRKRSESR